jgi:hypothetical protein
LVAWPQESSTNPKLRTLDFFKWLLIKVITNNLRHYMNIKMGLLSSSQGRFEDFSSWIQGGLGLWWFGAECFGEFYITILVNLKLRITAYSTEIIIASGCSLGCCLEIELVWKRRRERSALFWGILRLLEFLVISLTFNLLQGILYVRKFWFIHLFLQPYLHFYRLCNMHLWLQLIF